jgi:hypothetical protein
MCFNQNTHWSLLGVLSSKHSSCCQQQTPFSLTMKGHTAVVNGSSSKSVVLLMLIKLSGGVLKSQDV